MHVNGIHFKVKNRENHLNIKSMLLIGYIMLNL